MKNLLSTLSLLPVSIASRDSGNCLLQRHAIQKRLQTWDGVLCKSGVGEESLTEEHMRLAVSLGTNYMLHAMKPSGEFLYEFDYARGVEARDDDAGDLVNPVREAGAIWGLSLLVLDSVLEGGNSSEPLVAGLRKSLAHFAVMSKVFEDGRRIAVYPGLEKAPGKTGTLAVWALALTDFLRTKIPDGAERETSMAQLKGVLKSLESAVDADGRVHRKYSNDDGHFFREHSPYFDGETLLAFVKAAKYLGFHEYWPTVKLMVNAGWNMNVKEGLAARKDTDDMKGYYQWSSMAWYELLTSSQAHDYEAFSNRLIDYSLWIVEEHNVLNRTRNTGYAFEGLVPAFSVAKDTNRWGAVNTLGCAIDRGMRRVSSMQLGHPLAAGIAKTAKLTEQIQGGVQDAIKETKLRIDTTQHQMHAAILTRRLLADQQLI